MSLLEWRGLTLISAVGIDLLFGEPSNRFHPVAWMGTFIARWKHACPVGRWWMYWLWGLAFTVLGVVGVAAIGFSIEAVSGWVLRNDWHVALTGVAILINALALKSCFGIRSLTDAADTVYQALRAGDLQEARRCLAYHLVSRGVQELDESQVSAAAIESVAENTSDSVVAPLFFYLVAGLPGAMIYRYVNTCDAMVGYRKAELRWLGNVPARADDLLNLIPARLTVFFMMLASSFAPRRIASAVRVWWSDSGKTASPNAGHPMSGAAGLLGIRLEKQGQYVLGAELREPSAEDIGSMKSLFRRTVITLIVISSIVCLFSRGVYR